MPSGKYDMYVLLGSCFAQNVGQMMVSEGWDATVNPLGTVLTVLVKGAAAVLSSAAAASSVPDRQLPQSPSA